MPPNLPGFYWDAERNRYFKIAQSGSSPNVAKYNTQEVKRNETKQQLLEEKAVRERSHRKLYYTRNDLLQTSDKVKYANSPFYLMSDHFGMTTFYDSLKLQQMSPVAKARDTLGGRWWIHYDPTSNRLFYSSSPYPGVSILASVPYSLAALKGDKAKEQLIDGPTSGAHYHNFSVLPSGDVRFIKSENDSVDNSFRVFAGSNIFSDPFLGAAIDPAGCHYTIKLIEDSHIKKYSFERSSVVADVNFVNDQVTRLEYADANVLQVASRHGGIYNWDQRGRSVDFCLGINESPRQIAKRDHTLIVSGYARELKRFDLRYLKSSNGVTAPLVKYNDYCGNGGLNNNFQLSPSGDFFALKDPIGRQVKIYDVSLAEPLALNHTIKAHMTDSDFPPFTWTDNESLLVLETFWEVALWSASRQR